jgi:hypothetical protein
LLQYERRYLVWALHRHVVRGPFDSDQTAFAKTGERPLGTLRIEGAAVLAPDEQHRDVETREMSESVDARAVLIDARLDSSGTQQLDLSVGPLERPVLDVRQKLFLGPRRVWLAAALRVEDLLV